MVGLNELGQRALDIGHGEALSPVVVTVTLDVVVTVAVSVSVSVSVEGGAVIVSNGAVTVIAG